MDDPVREAIAFAERIPGEWAAMEPGEQIRRLRLRFGLNQKGFAASAGLPASLVCRVEKGADLRLTTLRRLFAGVGCRPLILPVGGLLNLDEVDADAEQAWRESPLGRAFTARGEDPLRF